MDQVRFWELFLPDLRSKGLSELDVLKASASVIHAFRTIREEEA